MLIFIEEIEKLNSIKKKKKKSKKIKNANEFNIQNVKTDYEKPNKIIENDNKYNEKDREKKNKKKEIERKIEKKNGTTQSKSKLSNIIHNQKETETKNNFENENNIILKKI